MRLFFYLSLASLLSSVSLLAEPKAESAVLDQAPAQIDLDTLRQRLEKQWKMQAGGGDGGNFDSGGDGDGEKIPNGVYTYRHQIGEETYGIVLAVGGTKFSVYMGQKFKGAALSHFEHSADIKRRTYIPTAEQNRDGQISPYSFPNEKMFDLYMKPTSKRAYIERIENAEIVGYQDEGVMISHGSMMVSGCLLGTLINAQATSQEFSALQNQYNYRSIYGHVSANSKKIVLNPSIYGNAGCPSPIFSEQFQQSLYLHGSDDFETLEELQGLYLEKVSANPNDFERTVARMKDRICSLTHPD